MTDLDYTIPGAAWSGHHLVFATDNPVVEKKLRRPALSPSVAWAYLKCPASAAGDRLMPFVEDPFAPNEMGSAAHGVMEDLHALPAPERTREKAREFLIKRADQVWAVGKLAKKGKAELEANKENRDAWLTTIDGWIDGQFQIEDPSQVDVHSVENLLDDVKIGAGVGGEDGIPLKGYVDRTDYVALPGAPEGEKALYVRDYKFGKPHLKPDLRYDDDYGDQQRIYVAGYTAKTGVAPLGATLFYPRAPGVREIDISPQAMRLTLMRFRGGWDLMNASADTRRYEARPSVLCSWCPLVNSCPVARKSDKDNAVAARAKAPSALQLGIPTLAIGATPDDVAHAGGVTVPQHPAPAVPANSEDLFPITLPSQAAPQPDIQPNLPGPTPEIAEQIDEVTETAQTVHVEDNTTTEGVPMEQQLTIRPEAVPYEETVGGMLNLNSYAAGGITHLVSIAFMHLDENGVPTGPKQVGQFSRVLAGIVQSVQMQVTGSRSFQLGANYRLRTLLEANLSRRPAPFGGTRADWEMWINRTTGFLTFALTDVDALWNNQSADVTENIGALASDGGGLGTPRPVSPSQNLTPSN